MFRRSRLLSRTIHRNFVNTSNLKIKSATYCKNSRNINVELSEIRKKINDMEDTANFNIYVCRGHHQSFVVSIIITCVVCAMSLSDTKQDHENISSDE